MEKWNEEAAPNNNLTPVQIKTSELIGKEQSEDHEFSEELSDGGERNKNIDIFQNKE